MFVYCFVLVSVVQEVWIHSLHSVHLTDPRYFLWLVIRFEQMGQMYTVGGPGLLSTSPARSMKRDALAEFAHPFSVKTM